MAQKIEETIEKPKTVVIDSETHEKLKIYCAIEHISIKEGIKRLIDNAMRSE